MGTLNVDQCLECPDTCVEHSLALCMAVVCGRGSLCSPAHPGDSVQWNISLVQFGTESATLLNRQPNQLASHQGVGVVL